MSAQASKEQEHQMDTTPGIFSWHEIFAKDPAATEKFYGGLFGWTTSTMDMGNGYKYTMFNNSKGAPVAGLPPPDDKSASRGWLNYVTVDDLDKAVAKAKGLGASIKVDVTKIPMGRFAVIADPQGATIGLWEYAQC